MKPTTKKSWIDSLVVLIAVAGATACPAGPPAVAGDQCGDAVCSGDETCASCIDDCGTCNRPFCGDHACNGREYCGNCEADCGPCPGPGCGDDVCAASETCANCQADCACATGSVCQMPGTCIETADAATAPDQTPARDRAVTFPDAVSGIDRGTIGRDAGGPRPDSSQQPPDAARTDAMRSDAARADSSTTCSGDCAALTYSACSCGPSDPCGWSGDGVCDLVPANASCAIYASHFDDSADCPAANGLIGSACASDGECDRNDCADEATHPGWVNGYCRVSSGCYDTSSCPSGAACISTSTEPTLDIGVCLKHCTSQPECRRSEGYACVNMDEKNGSGTIAVCVPYCDATHLCPNGYTCDSQDAWCVR